MADKKNENGRIYPRSLWEKILAKGHRVSERLANRQLVGLLGHPSDGKVDLAKVSHVTNKLFLQPDSLVYGESEILPTPDGEVGKTLFRNGVRLGVSSRGFGDSVRREDAEVLEDDFDLQGFDFVIDPSVAIAYPTVKSEEQERDVTSFQNLFSAITDRLQRFTSSGSDRPSIEEIDCYKAMLDEFVAVAGRNRQFMKAGKGEVVGLVEHARALAKSLSDAVKKFGEGTVTIKHNVVEATPIGRLDLDMPTGTADLDRLASSIDTLATTKEKEIDDLEGENARLGRETEALRRRLTAAEGLINASSRKLRDFANRYAAAESLLDAAVERGSYEAFLRTDVEARLEAAEALVKESVSRIVDSKKTELEGYKLALSRRLSNPEEALKALAPARTIEEASQVYLSLKNMSGKKPHRVDSALPRGGVVTEGKDNPANKVMAPKTRNTQVTESIIQRLRYKGSK